MLTPRFPLSVALAGLSNPPTLREQAAWASRVGFRAVAINGAAPESRARDLSRSGRRDMASLLRRHELTSAGVDLWVPPSHYTDPANADRAADAASDALELAADLASLTGGRAVLNVTLPGAEAASAAGLVAALVQRARTSGTLLADASWPPAWTGQGVAVCLDPASVMLGEPSLSPAKAMARAGAAVVCARLSDLGPGGRVEPGTGRLDLLAYLATLTVTPSAGPPVVDMRGLAEADAAARAIVLACGEARPA